MRASSLVHLLCLCFLLNNNSSKSGSEHCCQSVSNTWVDVDADVDIDHTPPDKLQGIPVSSSSRDELLCEEGNCPSLRKKRYILYQLNPGEGFNLRRDIFVRIAPLIKSLNNDKNNKQYGWVLVLPPWRNLPHWRHTPPDKSYPWVQFFSLTAIQEYIPILEIDQFMDEYGLDSGLDLVLNLAHFPFEDNRSSYFDEEIRIEKDCKTSPFKHNETNKKQYLWGHPFTTRRTECVSLRGSASTLLPLVQKEGLDSVAIFLNNAEVILWDEYGGEEWWRARAALKFDPNLIQIASTYLHSNNYMQDLGVVPYLGVHLRRRDFLLRKDNNGPVSIQQDALQISKICQELGLSSVFISTDAEQDEINELNKLLKDLKLRMWTYSPSSDDISEGERAIIDQLLATWSTHFLGTEGSTFTLRIFEERVLHGKHPDSTFNHICSSSQSSCKKPTRWLIPESLQHLIITDLDLKSFNEDKKF